MPSITYKSCYSTIKINIAYTVKALVSRRLWQVEIINNVSNWRWLLTGIQVNRVCKERQLNRFFLSAVSRAVCLRLTHNRGHVVRTVSL